MKKAIILLSTTVFVSFTMGAVLLTSNKMEKASASSYSVTSIPTTINLNDATASNIRSYYSFLNSLSTSERQGTNLLKNLKPILKNGQTYLSYGKSATTAVWQAYEIVDRDWVKSPASSISGYNSSTNIITGYTYGSSNSSVGTNPYIHALYVNRNITNQTKAWGNHNQDQWGINQEHVWAKSCGFNDESPAAGARGDIMHLWAGNGRVNGTNHSNYYYGYVDTTRSYDDAGSYASTLSGNRKGYSRTKGGSYTVFEPQDSDKGDIARALFYMVARYNYLSGSDSDGIDAGNPNLEIVNELNWAPGSSYTSTTSKKGQMGILQDLLEWNRLDPPDEWEIHRNNLCYNNFTHNRNPFIDFPEWAEFIWGKSVNGSYSSTSTGYATPSSDEINDFVASSEKTLSSISISGQTTNFNVGDTFSFGGTVTAHYSDSTTANVTSSSTFSGYNMSNSGNQTVTVSYTEGGNTRTTTYQINVSSSVTPTPTPTGDEYTWDLTTNSYNNNPTEDLVTWSSDFMTMESIRTDSKKTAANNYLGGDSNSRTSSRFYTGNTLSFTPSSGYTITSVVCTATSTTYANALCNSSWTNATAEVSSTTVTITPTNGSIVFSAVLGGTAGLSGVTFCYSSSSTPSPTLSSISLNTTNVQKEFTRGDTFNYSGLVVTAHYSDSSSEVVTPSSVSSPDMSTSGNKTITVTYSDKQATYQITVNEPQPTAIIATVSKTFKVGDTITKDDILLKDDLENVIDDYDFEDYQFTYEDAASGGELTEKDFDVEYNGLETTLTVEVQRETYVAPENTTLSFTGSQFSSAGVSNSYTAGQVKTVNGTQFLIDGYVYSGTKLSFSNGKTNAPGSLVNNAAFSTGITNVSVTGATPDIQLSVDGSEDSWVDLSSATPTTTNYYYFKLFYKNTNVSGYVNITQIDVELKGAETSETISNFVMFEDTNNQCATKFDDAVLIFANMSISEKTTFMTSSDYVISTARARLQAWATNQGKQITHVNSDYIIEDSSSNYINTINNNSLALIIIISTSSLSALSVLFLYLKKKKEI